MSGTRISTGRWVSFTHPVSVTPATYVQVPLDVLGSNDDVKSMFRWFATPPSYRADYVMPAR